MPKPGLSKIAVTYVPVLHRGYLKFFRNSGASRLYVVGQPFLAEVDYLRKDLRSLKPLEAVKLVRALSIFSSVESLSTGRLKLIDKPVNQIIMPDEDISRSIAQKLRYAKVAFKPVFLRWDRRNLESASKIVKSAASGYKPADIVFMEEAARAATKSSDIWRRVGAVLVDVNGQKIGSAYNKAEPDVNTPWMEGDPRNIFSKGVAIELSLFTHAEASLVAKAAKHGSVLAGGSMYVTTFPCPACAKLIALSGIKNLYYSEGYGVLDGERVLKSYQVQLVQVPVPTDLDSKDTWVPYKKKT